MPGLYPRQRGRLRAMRAGQRVVPPVTAPKQQLGRGEGAGGRAEALPIQGHSKTLVALKLELGGSSLGS